MSFRLRLPKLDRYLNAAFMAGLPSVRIVCGNGTGVLRQQYKRRWQNKKQR
jgi:dsDNA-specific endonuclease/ATPase MutS2